MFVAAQLPLVAEGLTLRFGAAPPVLDGLELAVTRGEHLAIVGPSGAGKTTLLRCLAGTLRPSAGSLRREGTAAVIHQDLRLVGAASALANVLHGSLGRTGLLRSVTGFGAADRARARQLLARVGLAGLGGRPVARLSGGERQRVAIARALMQDPVVLLADEPVAALDDRSAERVLDLLARLAHEQGLAVITVLHQRSLAARFADRVLALEGGRLRPADAKAPPAAGASPEPPAARAAEPAPPFSRPEGADGWPSGASTPASGAPRVATPASIATREGADEWLPGESSRASGAPGATPLDPGPALEARLLGGRPLRFAALAVLALGLYAWSLGALSFQARQLDAAPRNLLDFAAGFLPHSWDSLAALPWADIGRGLRETLLMSLLATGLGTLLSLPLALLAARNLSPGWIRRPVRLLLNALRTVPSIIWAMLFVAAVGLGALAGVLALLCYTLGYLTRFFSDAFEGADRSAAGALRELGASGPQCFAHAVWPAALPAFLSASLFMLEYNLRSASVLGVVDAGGIGVQLHELLVWRNFPGAAACLLLVLAVVVVLDALSSSVRDWAVRRAG